MTNLFLAKIYGIEHLLYVVVVAAIFSLILFLLKKYAKTDKQKRMCVIGFGVLGLIFILINRYAIACGHEDFLKRFYPTSACGILSFALSLSMIFGKKDSKIFHFLVYMCTVSGLLTLCYPDFLPQAESIWYINTISGLLHHTTLFINPIIMIVLGYVKPNIKKINYYFYGSCVLMTLGVFNVDILGYSSSVQIFSPLLPDTIFNWFVVGLMIYGIEAIFLVIYDYCINKEASFISKLFKK